MTSAFSLLLADAYESLGGLAIVAAFIPLLAFALLVLRPDLVVRGIFWVLAHTIYRMDIVGRRNVPQTGPACSFAITSASSMRCSCSRRSGGSCVS